MSQKTDTMIKLALVFFISLLSFSIGTFVGKKYSDNQHRLASLEPQKSNPHEAATTTEFASGHEGEKEKTGKMSDEEVAKIAEEFAQDDSIPSNPSSKAEEKTIANVENEKEIKEISAQPQAVADKKASSVKTVHSEMKKIEERKPSSVENHPTASTPKTTVTTTTTAISNMYTLQVGSFPTEDEASKLVKTLTDKGFKSSFIPASVNGKTWYRVNVGLFGTVKEAQDYKPGFLEKSKLTSAIVQKAPVTK